MFYQWNYIYRITSLTYARHYMDVDWLPKKVEPQILLSVYIF